jgi:sugar lactone lactonase YvrE
MRTRTIGICVLGLLGLTLRAAPAHITLLREAAAAGKAGDPATALAKVEAAAKVRPDYPRIQLNLARLYAEARRPGDALAALQRLADMGVAVNAVKDPSFAPLQELPRFQALAAQLAAPPARVGAVAPTAIDGVTGILEGLGIDATTGTWYFGDVRNRCIWRRDSLGAIKRFTAEADELDGVFKLAVSPDRRVLWATTATVGAMGGTPAPEGSRSALVALDLGTGRVSARYPVPADGRKHLLGDFTLAPDGAIFATDSFSPVIWRLPPGGAALEPWLENDDFLNLQGVAVSPNGKALYVADYTNGIWRIDVATQQASLLVAPPNATFFGLDGLCAVPGGLLATQNGVSPQRVLLIRPVVGIQPSPAQVVAAGQSAMVDLSLGAVDGTRFRFIADSGWAIFDPPPEKAPPPRTVTVYSFTIE